MELSPRWLEETKFHGNSENPLLICDEEGKGKGFRRVKKVNNFFSMWIFFHEHSRFTGKQGKGEAISLSALYHFDPLHKHLDISKAITAECSPLNIASSRTRTGNL